MHDPTFGIPRAQAQVPVSRVSSVWQFVFKSNQPQRPPIAIERELRFEEVRRQRANRAKVHRRRLCPAVRFGRSGEGAKARQRKHQEDSGRALDVRA
jgi:hypothetical protein